MSSTTYDTRFFVEHYYSSDPKVVRFTSDELYREKDKSVSSVVIHEVFRLTLQKEGRQVANLRSELISKDFRILPVDKDVAILSAELRQKYGVPMADSMIAASAMTRKAVCVTDDPHFAEIREIRTRWI